MDLITNRSNWFYLFWLNCEPFREETESAISIFGGSDYKPMNQWSQTDVDNFALNQQYILEQNIDTQLAVLEAK